jgi:hypothetical protein
MKCMLLIICAAVSGTELKAQTFEEWFRQDHTQLVYLQEQIAALAAFDDTQEQGNALSQNGLTTIDTIAEADYILHSSHFAYLDTPSPGVLADPAITTIHNYEIALARLTPSEVAIIKQRLDTILSTNALKMSDAERIKAINALLRDIKEFISKYIL